MRSARLYLILRSGLSTVKAIKWPCPLFGPAHDSSLPGTRAVLKGALSWGNQSEVIMSNYSCSRRSVIRLAVQLPVVGAVGGLLGACGKQTGPLCANPDDMSFSENSIRNVNNYTESSSDPEQKCLSCAFFEPGEPSESGEIPKCGQCEIFTGPASKNGHCDSWSAIEAEQA